MNRREFIAGLESARSQRLMMLRSTPLSPILSSLIMSPA
jgi:hypothetical protein